MVNMTLEDCYIHTGIWEKKYWRLYKYKENYKVSGAAGGRDLETEIRETATFVRTSENKVFIT